MDGIYTCVKNYTFFSGIAEDTTVYTILWITQRYDRPNIR